MVRSPKSDLFYAEKVAKHLDVNLSIIKIDPHKFISSLRTYGLAT